MPKKCQGKGSDFERLIARKLSLWIQGAEKPELFWRSASSGAAATQSRKRGQSSNMNGDLVAIAPAGQFFTNIFSLECKHYADYSLDEFLKPIQGDIKLWWAQCCRDAQHANKLPFLIFRKNNSPIFAMLCEQGRSLLRSTYNSLPEPHLVTHAKEIIFRFEDFLANYDAEALKIQKKIP